MSPQPFPPKHSIPISPKQQSSLPPKPTTSISPKPTVQAKISNFIPSIAFGKAEWGKYFGDVGIEPPLPANIENILNEPCSFWPDKKVKETHLLVLIPNTVNEKPFTMNYLGELIPETKVWTCHKIYVLLGWRKGSVRRQVVPITLGVNDKGYNSW